MYLGTLAGGLSALNRYEVELAAPVERAIRGLHRDDVRAHAEEIGARVRASTNVAYDPDEDPWHPPTAAVDTAVYVAETLAGYVGLGWPVPDDLRTLWAWYETGRWPAPSATAPSSSTESRSAASARGTRRPRAARGRP